MMIANAKDSSGPTCTPRIRQGRTRLGKITKHFPHLAAAAAVAGCAQAAPVMPRDPQPVNTGAIGLFHAADVLQDRWLHLPIEAETEYRLAYVGESLAIRAVGRVSASGLVRRVALDPKRCPIVEWTWRVDKIQAGANLRVKGREDVAASIVLMFGDPGMVSSPMPVPMLRYVWTNGRTAPGTVVDNPHLPGIVRSVVVKSGKAHLGKWVTERRNIWADYKMAFGGFPRERVHAIALYTDNDHTKEPVEAYYASARAMCPKSHPATVARRLPAGVARPGSMGAAR